MCLLFARRCCCCSLLEFCLLSGEGVREHSALCRRTHSTQIINMLLAKNAHIFRCYCQADTQADTRTLTRFWSGRARKMNRRDILRHSWWTSRNEKGRQNGKWGEQMNCGARLLLCSVRQHSEYQLALTLHWQTALHSRSSHIVIIAIITKHTLQTAIVLIAKLYYKCAQTHSAAEWKTLPAHRCRTIVERHGKEIKINKIVRMDDTSTRCTHTRPSSIKTRKLRTT